MPGPSNNYGSLRLEDDFGIKINEPEILSPKEIPDPQSQLNNNCSYKMPGREPLGKLPLISDEKLSQALDYAMQENNLNHIFSSKHNLDPLVKILGNQKNVLSTVLFASNGQFPSAGTFSANVNLYGYDIWIRGAMVNGIPKIGTMFIP